MAKLLFLGGGATNTTQCSIHRVTLGLKIIQNVKTMITKANVQYVYGTLQNTYRYVNIFNIIIIELFPFDVQYVQQLETRYVYRGTAHSPPSPSAASSLQVPESFPESKGSESCQPVRFTQKREKQMV